MNTTTDNTTRKRSTKSTAPKKNTRITEKHIRQRAFEIYLERGAMGGNEIQDWIQAERELKNSMS